MTVGVCDDDAMRRGVCFNQFGGAVDTCDPLAFCFPSFNTFIVIEPFLSVVDSDLEGITAALDEQLELRKRMRAIVKEVHDERL